MRNGFARSSYFGATSEIVTGWKGWLLVAVCGLGGGLAGDAYARLHLMLARELGAWMRAGHPIKRAVTVALVCGVIVAVVGVATHGSTMGAGYETARRAVEGQAPPYWYWPAKFVTTLATAVSGLPGGIFAPSLSIGAGLGGWLASLFGAQPLGIIVVLGMAGYFAGVVQAPLTAFVIVLEMTDANSDVIALMLASTLGYGASKLLSGHSLYHGLSAAFRTENE